MREIEVSVRRNQCEKVGSLAELTASHILKNNQSGGRGVKLDCTRPAAKDLTPTDPPHNRSIIFRFLEVHSWPIKAGKNCWQAFPWFEGEGNYPIPAYSEFMPPPRVGRKPYGGTRIMASIAKTTPSAGISPSTKKSWKSSRDWR